MPKAKILASLTALALAGTSPACAGGPVPAVSAKSHSSSPLVFRNRGTDVLYDQSDNDNGQGIVAQNFESSFDAYDTEGADDFKVPAGKIWKITEVYVDGTYFDGAGSARSFNVAFYSMKKGAIDKLVAACPNAGYTFDTHFDNGSEYIECKAKLKAGRYIVAVQANEDFAVGGEWGWLTDNSVRNRPSLWRNPNDGFATGCTDFAPTLVCIPNGGEGGDYAFALYGRVREARPPAASR